MDWVASSEAQRFTELVSEAIDRVREAGPFDPEANKAQLEACSRTLSAESIRWLVGMEIQLCERKNVYGNLIEADEFETILFQALEKEYRIKLIEVALEAKPLSVPELADFIGAEKPMVSELLTEMERRGDLELAGYDGRTPKFAMVAV